jgi:hypothetical protein
MKRTRSALFVLASNLCLIGTGALSSGDALADTPPPPQAPPGAQAPPEGTSSIVVTESGLGIRIERDLQDRPAQFQGNYVPLIVTVTQNDRPPTRGYEVFAQAHNRSGEQSDAYTCAERSSTSPTTPRGVFWCTVIVDRGGEWTFTGYVNALRRSSDDPPSNIGEASIVLNIDAPTLSSAGEPRGTVKGSAWSVAVLMLHAIFGVAWFACVAILLFLSVAGGRPLLSTRGLNFFEHRLERVITGLKATGVAVTGSGVYLLFKETAYDTPSSIAKLDAVSDLPYGRPYFSALIVKIGFYALVAIFSVTLVREARRRTTVLFDKAEHPESTKDVDPNDIWSTPGGGPAPRTERAPRWRSAAVLEDEVAVAEGAEASNPSAGGPAVTDHTTRVVRVAAVVMVIGALTIWTCVALLKYFHQLIEAANALPVN